jgi:hypothetical protein
MCLVLGLCGTALATARPSPTGPWIVSDQGNGRAVIAGHRTRSGLQNLRSLIRDWGAPARLSLSGDHSACVAVWSRPAARVLLRSYGYIPPGSTICSPRWGLIDNIATLGTRWRTDRGLAIGDAESAVSATYPNAFREKWLGVGRVWLLRPYEIPCIGVCDGEDTVEVSAVLAKVGGGTVRSFIALVGAEGE